jgi:hypothetical protein
MMRLAKSFKREILAMLSKEFGATIYFLAYLVVISAMLRTFVAIPKAT